MPLTSQPSHVLFIAQNHGGQLVHVAGRLDKMAAFEAFRVGVKEAFLKRANALS